MYPNTIKLIKPFTALPLVVVLHQSAVWAQEVNAPAAFYQQLYSFTRTDNRKASGRIRTTTPQNGPATLTQKESDDLAFNYLWLQQYQDSYRYKDGGAALGKIIQVGLKSLYRNYRGGGTIRAGKGDDALAAHHADLDYRLRLTGNKIKLAIEYDF